MITAPKALREARREPLPGDRETRLIDDKEKMKRADYAYVNTGSLEELDGFVGSVVEDLTSSEPASRLADRCSSPRRPASRRGSCIAPPDVVQQQRYPLRYHGDRQRVMRATTTSSRRCLPR